jgi:hypothetical protein
MHRLPSFKMKQISVCRNVVSQASGKVLWDEYGRRRPCAHTITSSKKTVEAIDDAHAHTLRFKPPDVDSNVKSRVYITDSD